MRLAPLALLLAVTGCIVVPARPPPPPPPSRPAQLLTEQQAVDVAADYARSRGYQILRTTRAVLDARARWHIDLTGPNSHANVLVDAASGQVLKARLRRGPPPMGPPPGPPPGSPPAAGPPIGPAPGDAGPQRRDGDDNWDE
jgi:hypothetical protein